MQHLLGDLFLFAVYWLQAQMINMPLYGIHLDIRSLQLCTLVMQQIYSP